MANNEVCLTDEEIKNMLDQALNCESLVSVGEVCDCLQYLFKHIYDTDFVSEFKAEFSKNPDKEMSHLMNSIYVSVVLTLMGNFKVEKQVGDA